MESWCDEIANDNSLLNLDNYYFVHQKGRYKRGGGICSYMHKQVEFKLRNDNNIFNDEIETCSVESVNSKARKSILTGVYRPPKDDIKVFKNYCKYFLKSKCASSKTDFMVGVDYDINKFIKKNLNLKWIVASYTEGNQGNENNNNYS